MNEPAMRSFLQRHPPARIAGLVRDELPGLAELGAREVEHALACSCGSVGFRLLGVPAAMLDRRFAAGSANAVAPTQRGYMLRSLLRIWRELRMASSGEDGGVLTAPIVLDCATCKARHVLVAPASDARDAVPAPLEALRCRPCRRSSFELTVVHGYEGLDFEAEPRPGDEERFVTMRLLARCRNCGRTTEPVAERKRDAQQLALDSLYGRDGSGYEAANTASEAPTQPTRERSS